MYSIQKIKEIVNGTGNLPEPSSVVKHLSVDSRRISFPGSTLFFALEGSKRSGSVFLWEAFEAGVRNFVLTRETAVDPRISGSNIIYVDDTLSALQTLTAFHRSQFHYPVIAITGSNGKTIVKEWLYQLLAPFYKIVKSPKSFNSQIGVPLSVWEMSADNDLAIFEAGISQPGEMRRLEKIIRPTIGVFTTIGNAHEENFTDLKQKINEKALLFKDTKPIIVPSEKIEVLNAFENTDALFRWGRSVADDVRITDIKYYDSHSEIAIKAGGREHLFAIPFSDMVYVYNALVCIAVLFAMEIPVEEIRAGLAQLKPVDMRLQLVNGINNCTLINDSYSFDINAFSLALDFLLQQKQQNKKTLIISDLPVFNEKQYEQLAEMINHKSLFRVFTIGEVWFRKQKEGQVLSDCFPYRDVDTFINAFNKLHFSNEVILLKGARIFGFEKIVSALQSKSHSTRLEINLSALTHNLNFYRNKLSRGVKLMAMVKAFAYGSGSAQVASLLQFHKVDYLAVAYADEGVELRKAGIHIPILVLNVNEDVFESLLQYKLEPELFSFSIVKKFAGFLTTRQIEQYPVHLKLDTGMHRLGFEEKDMTELLRVLKEYPQLRITSVFSHFAASDDKAESDFTAQQAAVFERCTNLLEENLLYPFIRHISNSAAIAAVRQYQYDMVRLGIGLYGVETAEIDQKRLQVAISLKTTIAQIRNVPGGDTIGYNRSGKAERDSKIATIRIGYADGFKRQLSNGRGKVFVRGKEVPVIGIVSMDMTMVDITGIPGISEEDEVEIFGQNISVQEVARRCDTIPYEILTGISQRVKRVYIEE